VNRTCLAAALALAALPALSAVEEEAAAVLRRAVAPCRDAQRVRVTFERRLTVEREGASNTLFVRHEIALQRPDRLAIRRLGGAMEAEIYTDGRQAVVYAPQAARYAVREGPTPLEATLGADAADMLSRVVDQAAPFFTSLFREDPFEDLMEGVLTGRVAGRTEEDGADTVRLACTQEDFDWDVWIEDGAAPRIRRVEVDLAKRLDPAAREQGVAVRMTLGFEDWAFDPDLPPGTFTFVPPEGTEPFDFSAIRVPSLFEGNP
jgi:hypothetical protein